MGLFKKKEANKEVKESQFSVSKEQEAWISKKTKDDLLKRIKEARK